MPRGKVRDRDGIFTRRDRPGYYGSWVDAAGRRKKRKLKGAHTLEQARTMLRAEQTRVEETRLYGMAPPTNDNFSGLIKPYLTHQRVRLTSAAYERTRGVVENHLKHYFGMMKLFQIRRADIQRYITNRSSDVLAGTVLRELNVLKHILGFAVEAEMIPFNPAQGVKGPKVPPGRLRYLQPTELRAVLQACPPWLRPIAGLAVATGMRRGEILGLRWLDVDRKGARILVPQTKNGDSRIVYLNKMACEVLDSVSATVAADVTPMELIFQGITPEQVSITFLRTCRGIGIQDFRWHDLRHTAASWLRMSGADIHTVALILGHKDLRMAARYQHLSPAFLGQAVNRLDAVFMEKKKLQGKRAKDGTKKAPKRGEGSSVQVPTASPKEKLAIKRLA